MTNGSGDHGQIFVWIFFLQNCKSVIAVMHCMHGYLPHMPKSPLGGTHQNCLAKVREFLVENDENKLFLFSEMLNEGT